MKQGQDGQGPCNQKNSGLLNGGEEVHATERKGFWKAFGHLRREMGDHVKHIGSVHDCVSVTTCYLSSTCHAEFQTKTTLVVVI